MEIWFKRILERGDKPIENDEGTLVTAVPEDIFSLIKTQAMLAGEHLKGTVLIKAIQVGFRNSKNHSQICTAPLSVYTQYFTERIKEELYSDRELCAIINNNNLLREHIESLPWLVGDDELTEEQTVDLNSMLNNVTAPLIELNTLAAHALGDLIIGDIDAARVSGRVI